MVHFHPTIIRSHLVDTPPSLYHLIVAADGTYYVPWWNWLLTYLKDKCSFRGWPSWMGLFRVFFSSAILYLYIFQQYCVNKLISTQRGEYYTGKFFLKITNVKWKLLRSRDVKPALIVFHFICTNVPYVIKFFTPISYLVNL